MSKIIYELEKSPHIVTSHNMNFYFSSLNCKEKFEIEVDTYVRYHVGKCKQLYGCTFVNIEMYLAHALYLRVEKRGYCVSFNGVLKKERYGDVWQLELLERIEKS